MMDDLDELIARAVGDDLDPYPQFADNRKSNPVACEDGYDGNPIYSVYRYADVAHVLREPEVFSSRVYAPAIGLVFGPSIIQMDGAEHFGHRKLIGGAFRRSVLAGWERSLVEPTVHELIDGFAARGNAELVRELTIRFPIRIIARLLGIPVADFDTFTRLTIELISIVNDIEVGLRASAALRDYLAGIVEARRRTPGDDLISTLVQADIDGTPLSDDEIFGFLRLLLPAGAETTYRLLGTLLLALLRAPALLDRVREDRSLIAPAMEEALRWESPVQYVSREPVHDVELAGASIPAGSHVSLALGSANHDETVFENPEAFDPFAERPPHLAFAEGPHRCLGEHLARMETTVAVNAILDRLGGLRLDSDGEEPRVQGHAFRSPNRLPVRFEP